MHSVLLAILLAWISGPAQADLARDPKLQQRVTLRLKIVTLPQLVKQLATQTGADIDVAPNLAELKITAICKDRPAYEVMNRVGTLFAYRWEKVGERYLLTCPQEIAAEEANYLDLDRRLAREQLEKEISQWMELAKKPQSQVQSERERAEKKLIQISKSGGSGDDDGKLFDIMANSGDEQYELGAIFRQMDAAAVDRFWSGKLMIASTVRLPGLYRIPVPTGQNGSPVSGSEEPVSERWIALRYNTRTGDLGTWCSNFDSKGDGLGGEGGAGNSTRLEMGPSPRGSHPLMKRVQAWITPITSSSPLLEKKINDGARKAVAKSLYTNHQLSLADQLEWVADAYDVPVIADAYRIGISGERFETRAATLRDWLKTLASGRADWQLQRPPWRLEGDWLLMRHSAFWKLKQLEAPESTWAGLEKKGKSLTLDDYAAFASRLTASQGEGLGSSCLSTAELSPLTECMPALRFWSGLDASQKTKASTQQGLRLSEISATQREAFFDIAWEGIYAAFHSKPLRSLAAGSPTLGLFVHVGPTPDDPDPDINATFRFGPPTGSGIVYQGKMPKPQPKSGTR